MGTFRNVARVDQFAVKFSFYVHAATSAVTVFELHDYRQFDLGHAHFLIYLQIRGIESVFQFVEFVPVFGYTGKYLLALLVARFIGGVYLAAKLDELRIVLLRFARDLLESFE